MGGELIDQVGCVIGVTNKETVHRVAEFEGSEVGGLGGLQHEITVKY